MKVSRSRLKRIINEEIRRLLVQERDPSGSERRAQTRQYFQGLVDQGLLDIDQRPDESFRSALRRFRQTRPREYQAILSDRYQSGQYVLPASMGQDLGTARLVGDPPGTVYDEFTPTAGLIEPYTEQDPLALDLPRGESIFTRGAETGPTGAPFQTQRSAPQETSGPNPRLGFAGPPRRQGQTAGRPVAQGDPGSLESQEARLRQFELGAWGRSPRMRGADLGPGHGDYHVEYGGEGFQVGSRAPVHQADVRRGGAPRGRGTGYFGGDRPLQITPQTLARVLAQTGGGEPSSREELLATLRSQQAGRESEISPLVRGLSRPEEGEEAVAPIPTGFGVREMVEQEVDKLFK